MYHGIIAPMTVISRERKRYLSHVPAFETIPLASCLLSSVIFEEYNKHNKDDNKRPLRVFLGQYYEEYKNIQQDHCLKEFTDIHSRRQGKIYRN